MVIWPEASNAQNSIAAVSAEGSTVCVLIRRLNSSWSRSIALVVRADFHWLSGSRVKVKSRSPASSKLSATARHFSRRPVTGTREANEDAFADKTVEVTETNEEAVVAKTARIAEKWLSTKRYSRMWRPFATLCVATRSK